MGFSAEKVKRGAILVQPYVVAGLTAGVANS